LSGIKAATPWLRHFRRGAVENQGTFLDGGGGRGRFGDRYMVNWAMRPVRVICLGLFAATLALSLAACGDEEPKQRAAFIAFLNDRIVSKPGVHLPVPTDEETKSFGPYAAQLAVIVDFNHKMDEVSAGSMGGFATLSQQVHSLGDVIAHKQDIAKLHDALAGFQPELKKQIAAADAARAALPPQPDDLKAVYAAAYDRDVTAPSTVMADALPALDETVQAMLAIANFVAANGSKITINGSMVNTTDPKLQPQLQDLLAKLNAASQKTSDARDRLMKTMNGG
jgi:hypothetical protein